MLVNSRDLVADKDDASAVPFICDRRGFNCVKLTSIIRQILDVLNCSVRERFILDKFKSATINDNHLYRLRLEECAGEIAGFFAGSTPDPAAAARAFRLAILDRIASRAVTPPAKATPADYDAAAKWVTSLSSKQGALKSAVWEWLTNRNVELQWWRLQARCRPLFSVPAVRHADGRQRHMPDMLFLKYVVPIMQSTGPLKHSVETWMDVMCAVDMLQNGMLSVDQSGQVDRHDDGVMKAVWQGKLPSSGRHPNQTANYIPFPKDRATAVNYLKKFDLSARTAEALGPHRLSADPDQVESVFDTLKNRIEHHGITDLRHILVTDEFRLKKEMERVIAAIEAVAGVILQ